MVSSIDAAVARSLKAQHGTQVAAAYLKRHGYSVQEAAAFLAQVH